MQGRELAKIGTCKFGAFGCVLLSRDVPPDYLKSLAVFFED